MEPKKSSNGTDSDWEEVPNGEVASDWEEVDPNVSAEEAREIASAPRQENSFLDKLKNPDRWQAILTGTGPNAQEVIQGDVPSISPASATPKLAAFLTKVAGNRLGRAGLGATQGAIQGFSKDATNLDKPMDKRLGDAASSATVGGLMSGAGEGIRLGSDTAKMLGKVLSSTKLGALLPSGGNLVKKLLSANIDKVATPVSKGAELGLNPVTEHESLDYLLTNQKKKR